MVKDGKLWYVYNFTGIPPNALFSARWGDGGCPGRPATDHSECPHIALHDDPGFVSDRRQMSAFSTAWCQRAGGQLTEVVPDLELVTVVASTDATGAAEAEVYLDLVSSYIAPAIGR